MPAASIVAGDGLGSGAWADPVAINPRARNTAARTDFIVGSRLKFHADLERVGPRCLALQQQTAEGGRQSSGTVTATQYVHVGEILTNEVDSPTLVRRVQLLLAAIGIRHSIATVDGEEDFAPKSKSHVDMENSQMSVGLDDGGGLKTIGL